MTMETESKYSKSLIQLTVNKTETKIIFKNKKLVETWNISSRLVKKQTLKINFQIKYHCSQKCMLT